MTWSAQSSPQLLPLLSDCGDDLRFADVDGTERLIVCYISMLRFPFFKIVNG